MELPKPLGIINLKIIYDINITQLFNVERIRIKSTTKNMAC